MHVQILHILKRLRVRILLVTCEVFVLSLPSIPLLKAQFPVQMINTKLPIIP
jgi:hypothetical protein